MSEIVLHIGLLKTASTTLQDQFFPACVDLNLLHRSTVPDMGKFINLVVNKNPAFLNQNDGQRILSEYIDHDKVNLISAENLSGQLFATVGLPSLDFRYQILQNLSKIYPEAKVVIVIRRQDGLAKSMYREYLRQGGTKSVARYFGQNNKLPVLTKDCFLFKPYIDSINNLFPRGVQVLAFEEFIDDQTLFLSKLKAFIGINNDDIELTKTNSTRMGGFGLEVTRVLNCLFRSQLNPAGIFPRIPIKTNGVYGLKSPVELLHNAWPGKGIIKKSSRLYVASKEILSMCKDDNKDLDETYSLGLNKYNYW